MSKYFRYFPKITYEGEQVTDITRRVKINNTLLNDPYLFLPYTVKGDERPEDVAYYYYGDVNKVWLVYLANNIIDPYTQWTLSNDNFEKTIRKKYYHDVTVNGSSINVSSNVITSKNHGFKTTDPVMFNANGTIGGLVDGTRYYAIRTSNDQFKLASTVENARLSTAVNITSVDDKDHSFELFVDEFLMSTSIDSNVLYCVNSDGDTKVTYDTYLLGIASEDLLDWTVVRAYEYEVEQNENRRIIWLVNKDYAALVEADLAKVLNV